ncbi:MAG: hypothetical protein ACO1SX_13145 [Actinomycetota bacterium]
MITASQSQTEQPAPHAPPFYAGVANRSCRLTADSAAGQLELEQRFGAYRAPAEFAGAREIRLRLRDDALPRLTILDGGRRYDCRDIAAGPEWKRLAVTQHSSRLLFADSVVGPEPALEVTAGGIVVLQPAYWPLYTALAWRWLLLRDRAVCTVHAAVSAFQGEALVLISASGMGKSTLTHALHALGADYFTDEEAWFSLPEHELHPLPKRLCLRPGGTQALGLSADANAWYEAKPGDLKHVVRLPPPTRPRPKDRARLIFLEGFAAEPELRPMTGGEATRSLFRSLGYGSPILAERLRVAAGLANRYPCYGLSVGSPALTADLLLQSVASSR